MKSLIEIWKSRFMIFNLAKADFKQKYLGSYIGITWAILNPLITILVLWFVFNLGFRASNMNGYPFFLWLVTGLIPWFFLVEGITQGTTSIFNYNFLVKKIVFNVSLLPIVRIVSALIIHVIFIILLCGFMSFSNYSISIYWIQIPYYVFCSILLILSITWITSALCVFTRDISNIVNVVMQLGIWITPIFWSIEQIPASFSFLLKANPAYYLVSGYRDIFLLHKWFWENPMLTIYFWLILIISLFISKAIFNKLRPIFADIV